MATGPVLRQSAEAAARGGGGTGGGRVDLASFVAKLHESPRHHRRRVLDHGSGYQPGTPGVGPAGGAVGAFRPSESSSTAIQHGRAADAAGVAYWEKSGMAPLESTARPFGSSHSSWRPRAVSSSR